MKHFISTSCILLLAVILLSLTACRSTQSMREATAEQHIEAQASSVQNLAFLDSIIRRLEFSADSVFLEITMGTVPSLSPGVHVVEPICQPDSLQEYKPQKNPPRNTQTYGRVIDPEDFGVSCSCGQELLTPSPIPSLNLQFKAYKPKLSTGEDEKVILDQKSSQSSQVTDDSNSSETDQREKSASKGAVWFFLLVGLFVLLAIADVIIYATKGTSFFRWLGKLIGNVFHKFLG